LLDLFHYYGNSVVHFTVSDFKLGIYSLKMAFSYRNMSEKSDCNIICIVGCADRLTLAQISLLRGITGTGRTPFSPFHIWLSDGDWLLQGGERRGWELSDVSFWVWGSWSDTLSWISLRDVVLGCFGRPVGKTVVSSTSRSYEDARICTELKPVWFGDF